MHTYLVGHLVVDILAASASDDAENTKRHGDYRNDTMIRRKVSIYSRYPLRREIADMCSV